MTVAPMSEVESRERMTILITRIRLKLIVLPVSLMVSAPLLLRRLWLRLPLQLGPERLPLLLRLGVVPLWGLQLGFDNPELELEGLRCCRGWWWRWCERGVWW